MIQYIVNGIGEKTAVLISIEEWKKFESYYRIFIENLKVDTEQKNILASAAQVLLDDYLHDEELTAFTTLDHENFYEPR
ncbi:MAG: hypothetical protein EAZ08_06850 [Cytophagales bacterium]|nr:MAG: hypothetical protein EAZ08_06850 [Cytophagales bacterium]